MKHIRNMIFLITFLVICLSENLNLFAAVSGNTVSNQVVKEEVVVWNESNGGIEANRFYNNIKVLRTFIGGMFVTFGGIILAHYYCEDYPNSSDLNKKYNKWMNKGDLVMGGVLIYLGFEIAVVNP